MRFQDIQKMAKGMDINTYSMKNTDMIRGIQGTENKVECYGTQRIGSCQEETCLWRSDCLSDLVKNGRWLQFTQHVKRAKYL